MRLTRLLHRPSARRRIVAWTLAGIVVSACPERAPGGVSSSTTDKTGLQAMPAIPHSNSILVDYYDALRQNGDIEAFRRDVAARYNEATLARVLDGSDIPARRAAALSLGLFGSFARSNAVIARAFRDKDPVVRALANDAAWSIWFRGGTPPHNQRLDAIRQQIGAGDLDGAIKQADRLVADAPTFAEAYNQRAIARFLLGNLEASVQDCRLVLQHNPHHIGALSGQGQCLLRLNRTEEAVAVFRRALEVQPFDNGLRVLVADLEAGR